MQETTPTPPASDPVARAYVVLFLVLQGVDPGWAEAHVGDARFVGESTVEYWITLDKPVDRITFDFSIDT
jgi:hypothetical protein